MLPNKKRTSQASGSLNDAKQLLLAIHSAVRKVRKLPKTHVWITCPSSEILEEADDLGHAWKLGATRPHLANTAEARQEHGTNAIMGRPQHEACSGKDTNGLCDLGWRRQRRVESMEGFGRAGPTSAVTLWQRR